MKMSDDPNTNASTRPRSYAAADGHDIQNISEDKVGKLTSNIEFLVQ